MNPRTSSGSAEPSIVSSGYSSRSLSSSSLETDSTSISSHHDPHSQHHVSLGSVSSMDSVDESSSEYISMSDYGSRREDTAPLIRTNPGLIGCNDDGSCVDRYLAQRKSTPVPEHLAKAVFDASSSMIRATAESKEPKKVHKFTALEFFRTLRKCPFCKTRTDEKGYNLVFIVVLEGRVDFLEVLAWCDVLFDLLDVTVTNRNSKYVGLAAKDLITKFNLKKISAELENLKKLESSLTKLHKLARAGHEEGVSFLLERHPQMMETPAADGSNSLMWAVTSGNLEVVKMFVRAGGDYRKATYSDETPLGRATFLGFPDIIRYLIEDLSCDPDIKCKGDLTPVSIAINNGDLNTLRVLVECKAVITNEALPLLATLGKADVWKYVLKNVRDLDIDWTDKNGRNSLYLAVENGSLEIVKDLVQQNALLTQKDRAGRNVLFAAIDSNNMEMFQYILHILKLKALLGSLINNQDLYRGKEQLFTVTGRDNGILGYHFISVHRIYLEIFAKRIREGGQLDIARFGEIITSGWGTPSAESREEVNRRYELSMMDSSKPPDLTPLHYAILHRRREMALMLLKEGADVNIKDNFGNQPLHIAAMRGDIEIVNALEDFDLNYDFPGHFGMTALDVAEANRHQHIVELIEGKQFLNENGNQQQIKALIEQTKAHLKELETAQLHKQRRRGRNVKQVIIGKCRDMQHGINSLLYNLGSTQIQQASEG